MSGYSKDNLGNGWEVSVARTFDEVEAVRPIWEKMQDNERYPVPNADIDRYLAVLEPQKEQMQPQPYVMLFRQQDEPKTMVIARLEKHRLTCRIGYKVICNPSLRCLIVVYGGILGKCDKATSNIIVQELLSTLRSDEVDMVWFNQLRTDARLYQLSRRIPGFMCRNHWPVILPHWQTYLPGYMEESYDTMSNIRSRNRYLKRYTKALEKACSGPVEMVCYGSQDDLDYVISVAHKISSNTYKHGLNVGFRDDPITRSLLTQYARKGWLRAYILHAGGKPCAFEFGIKYGESFFPEYIGYDPQLRSCSPGTVLFMKVFEDLANDSEIKIFDYGFGDAVYKKRFGTRFWPEASIYIFAPRLYPVSVNMLQSLIAGLSLGLRFFADKMNITGPVKRRWRDRLQKKTEYKKRRVGT